MRTLPTGRKNRKAGGFTLVELSLVAVLIVVLAAVAAPAFAGFWRATQVRACAWQIATLARAARDYSICHGAQASLEYDSEKREFRLAAESDPVNAPGEFADLRLASAQPVKVPDAVQDVEIWVEGQAWDQDRPPVFFADGQALHAQVVLQTESGNALSVEVRALTGRARVVEGDVHEVEENANAQQ